MSIKIFLPKKLYYTKENCDIYGEIKISEHNCISYYITCAVYKSIPSINHEEEIENLNNLRDSKYSEQLRHLGYIVDTKSAVVLKGKDVALTFFYDKALPNILLNKLSIKPEESNNISLFLYDELRILKLQDLNESGNSTTATGSTTSKRQKSDKGDTGEFDEDSDSGPDDLCFLFQLLQIKENIEILGPDEVTDFFVTDLKNFLTRAVCLAFQCIMGVLTFFMFQPPFKYVFQYTVLYEHYKEWRKFKNCGKRRFNIAFDTFLGLCVMLILVLYIDSPGDYLIKASHFIVSKFRILLHSLKGSPIGLKLNVHLNNFLLDCFGYHVELWATFLNVIEPCIRQLFVPITFLGSMGLSYQLALVTDIISVIGLHAHCFSIYAAVLYKVEIKGLQVLWKVVLGKRKNVLKNRVESHNYMNRQLYLATVFFACLLFLFPTVVTYYVVFTTLRLCIGFVSYILKTIRRHVLEFPLEMLWNWCWGKFYDTVSLQIEYVEHTPASRLKPDSLSLMEMCVFNLSVHSSSLGRVLSCRSGVLEELVGNEENSVKKICQKILTGTF